MKALKTILISAVLCLGLQSYSFATREDVVDSDLTQTASRFSPLPIHVKPLACDEEETEDALDEGRLHVNNDHAAVMEVDDGDSFSEQIQNYNDLQGSVPDKRIVPDEDHVEGENNTKTIGSSHKRKHLESPFAKDHAEEIPSAKRINQQQTALKPHRSIEGLDDEIMLMIFSSLNQKDIPSTVGTSKRWRRLMDDNQLWKGYAKKAFVIMNDGGDSQDRNYKAFIKAYSIPSFTDLRVLNGGRAREAFGASFDGSVIVGDAEDGAAQGEERAFRWTREEGMESVEKLLTDRGVLPPDWILTEVRAITPDGIVLVGDGQHKVQMVNGNAVILTRAWRAVIPRGNLF